MFIRRSKDDRASGNRPPLAKWRAWFVGATLTLGFTATASGQEPAASLLPPQPSRTVPAPYVSRGAEAEAGKEEALPKAKPRGSEFHYPPTYTSSKPDKNFPLLSSLWKKVVGENDEKKAVPAKDLPKLPAPAVAVPVLGSIPGDAVPAWHWYGYGAPVLGLNPLARQGVYAPVNPAFYAITGATPGAIPIPIAPSPTGSFMPHLPPHEPVPVVPPPVLPLPDPLKKLDVILPPEEAQVKTRPAGIGAPTREMILPPEAEPARKPATLELPGQPAKPNEAEPAFTPILPVSARSTTPVARAQSPDVASVPSALVANLRSACTGYASKIELVPKGSNKLGLRLTLISGIQADHLANRIAQIPDLAGYEVEMEFAR